MQLLQNNTPIRSIFISKAETELRLLSEFCSQRQLVLTAHSFLSFEAVVFKSPDFFDVVFFASPRAARFFLTQTAISSNVQIAVAGESTRSWVEFNGYHVHFSPINSGHINESALEFKTWLGDRKVLFPTSDISQKSYTACLDAHQFKTVQVYKTQISTEKIEKHDVYVFTSPSNVRGFLASNTFPDDSIIIAWGETTATALQGIVPETQLIVLPQSSEENLLQILAG
jgi:uroporphyrinogen-III synthase